MANDLLLWLGFGSFIGIFVAGRWSLAPAAWIGPVILLHVAHQAPLEPALYGIWAAIAFGILVSHWRVIPLPWFAYPVVVALIAIPATLPYLADRLLAPYLPGVLSTLVFPLAATAGEYLGARTSPFGTWGSVAYTQASNHPLMQLASVTGLWGIVFLVAWFASLSLWAWEHRSAPDEFMPGVLLYAGILLVVLAWGRLRINRATQTARTVRVAAIGWPDGVLELDQLLRAFASDLKQEERSETAGRICAYQ